VYEWHNYLFFISHVSCRSVKKKKFNSPTKHVTITCSFDYFLSWSSLNNGVHPWMCTAYFWIRFVSCCFIFTLGRSVCYNYQDCTYYYYEENINNNTITCIMVETIITVNNDGDVFGNKLLAIYQYNTNNYFIMCKHSSTPTNFSVSCILNIHFVELKKKKTLYHLVINM
jgi:hypothetical protein